MNTRCRMCRGRACCGALPRIHDTLTYIYAEPGGSAQRLYHRLGFRTVATNLISAWAWHIKE